MPGSNPSKSPAATGSPNQTPDPRCTSTCNLHPPRLSLFPPPPVRPPPPPPPRPISPQPPPRCSSAPPPVPPPPHPPPPPPSSPRPPPEKTPASLSILTPPAATGSFTPIGGAWLRP